jgi:hypothetical protein
MAALLVLSQQVQCHNTSLPLLIAVCCVLLELMMVRLHEFLAELRENTRLCPLSPSAYARERENVIEIKSQTNIVL